MSESKAPMSEADQKELERLRAEAEERRLAALEAEKHPPLTLAEQVKEAYIQNHGTIQTIARHYNITVDEVLIYIGQPEMAQVETIGDLVDQNELGPVAEAGAVKPIGRTAKVPFDLS